MDKKNISERFGVAICQIGLALAFIFYILTLAALLPIRAIVDGMPHYRIATAFEWVPPVFLSLLAGFFLLLYRRKIFNPVYVSLGLFLAALGSVLFSVRYPVALIMLFCFSGSCNLLFDVILPQSKNWKSTHLVLLNLILCFLGFGLGLLAFSAASTFVVGG
jgi:hypothetical protein